MTEMNQEIRTLLAKYLQDSLSREELDRLRSLIANPANDAVTSEWIGEAIVEWDHKENTIPIPESLFSKILEESERIRTQDPAHPGREQSPVRKMNRTLWWAAASILLIAAIGAGILKIADNSKNQAAQHKTEIAPGKNGAILTLADGTKMVLDSLGNGWATTQNGASLKLQNGQLTYAANTTATEAMTYNTMTVPKGRQFKLVLPDGTQVWLNAGSSLKYPTTFSGKERNVEMTGEAYFEVAQNASRPFKVKAPGVGEIEVLGTSFNVNSYEDEPFSKTTLLTGAVIVGSEKTKLSPGQQVKRTSYGQIEVIDNVDLDQVIAWKNGMFNFNGSDIKTVLRQITRWYDIDVVYAAEPENTPVSGEMQRNLSLNAVMDILKDLDIKYTLDGRKMIISK